MDLPRTRQFLASLAALPADAQAAVPILRDIAALCSGTPGGAASWGPVRRGLNRRYLRIRFVQHELERLDFKKAKPGVAFADFVFNQIDFSAYKKISAEEYSLYTREGLEDFEPPFFTRNFRLGREQILDMIRCAYARIGSFYYIKHEKMLTNPLLVSVLRTLQTSLEFAPLFTGAAIWDECRTAFPLPPAGEGESNRLFASLLRPLHGASVIHTDGMKTDLSVLREERALLLKGAFHPQGKTSTITLFTGQEFGGHCP